ncbi:sensor histidine kinase [Streptomyces sp. NBC_01465]|uniref:sensor histidine kinase n=1 Tax=Streptomyces sp. NBC_01465 TaxID=2903878 RepID=UPI002E32C412|nr:histidine kinase [Streptomyces sp. NBC_01465]
MRRLLGARARRRWVHLILGGALLMPYFLVGMVIVGAFAPSSDAFSSLPHQFAAFGFALPLAAVTGLLPLVRPLSVYAVRALCGIDGGLLADGPAGSRAARVRTAGWYTLHVGAGGVVSGATLALPPFAVLLIALPFSDSLRTSRYGVSQVFDGWRALLAPPAGLAMLCALALCAAAAGELLARTAPVLLGPSPTDRLAAAEKRAADLAVRNRLARELHDSVGHALSAVTLQAGAARRVLETDVEFVREALTAIEETTRRTVGELDAVLGLLREGEDQGATGPTLEGLDGLLAHCGVKVDCTVTGDPAVLAAAVSREAYRIVQEGLSNALRYGGSSRVGLRIAVLEEKVEITMENPLPEHAPVVRPGGGRGLPGIAERAALLGGRAAAGPHDGVWRLTAELPR